MARSRGTTARERLLEAEKRAARKQAAADDAAARVRVRRKRLKESEIKSAGVFTRDSGLLKIARTLPEDRFDQLLLAVADPRKLELLYRALDEIHAAPEQVSRTKPSVVSAAAD